MSMFYIILARGYVQNTLHSLHLCIDFGCNRSTEQEPVKTLRARGHAIFLRNVEHHHAAQPGASGDAGFGFST